MLKVPARAVMELLGHSSYQLTMNTCSHVAPELNSEAAQLMAGALWVGDETAAVRLDPPATTVTCGCQEPASAPMMLHATRKPAGQTG